jgi:thiol-disulfide isomerase/thioredoxin
MLLVGCSRSPNVSTDSKTAATPTKGTAGPPAEAKAESLARQSTTAVSTRPSADKVTLEPVTPAQFDRIVGNQKGKVVLVDFWATWCAPCRAKFPQTLALAKKYGDQGLTVISVSMDSPEPAERKKALQFLREQDAEIMNLASALDDTDAAFGGFKIDGGALPHYKVFDRKGNLRRTFGGDLDHPFDEKDIEKTVAAALKGQ